MMVIGNGLLANAFRPRFEQEPAVLIFASGVSDSTCRDPAQFDRERSLLSQAIEAPFARRVYFSSCALGDPDAKVTPYLTHKRQMEDLARRSDGLVLRLPQVVGPTGNPNTLTNYLYRSIRNGQRFTVWRHAERNLVDVDDVLEIATCLIANPARRETVCSIASQRSTPMLEIVETFERVLGIKADYELVDRVDSLRIDSTVAQEVAAGLGIDMGPAYAERIIRKYYGHQ